MIVIFNVSLYRIGFMFRTAERTFRSAEHKTEAYP